MTENDKKYLLRTFDDIIELMATQGQKLVCIRLQRIRKLLKEQEKEIENLKELLKNEDDVLETINKKLDEILYENYWIKKEKVKLSSMYGIQEGSDNGQTL